MNKKEKTLALKRLLTSGNTTLIDKGLEDVKKSGTADSLWFIFDILNQETTQESIVKKAKDILFSLKDQKCTEIIIKGAKDKTYKTLRATLLSALWQSNLDCSSYLSDLLQITLDSNFQTGIEYYSIIESLKPPLPINELKEALQVLEKALSNKSYEHFAILEQIKTIIHQTIQSHGNH